MGKSSLLMRDWLGKQQLRVLSLLIACCFVPMATMSVANAVPSNQDPTEVLQLLGAIAGKNGAGVALVKYKPDGKIKAIRRGEDVFGFGNLQVVDRFAMEIRTSSGQTVSISSKFGGNRGVGKGPIVNTEDKYIEEGFSRIGNRVEVDARFRDRMLKQELPTILMQASSEPVMENGQIVGFRLFQFEPDSMFQKLGIKDGDVVKEINGIPLNNVARTVQLLNGLKQEPNVSVTVMRDGAPVSLQLSVK